LAARLPGAVSEALGIAPESSESPRPVSRALPNFKSALNLGLLGAQAEADREAAAVSVAAASSEKAPLLATQRQGLERNGSREYLRSYVNEFLDSHAIKGRQWVIFAAAWNEVIDSMRSGDLLSNGERDTLRFDSFMGFAKPIYLPVFQTAGLVESSAAAAANLWAAAGPDVNGRPGDKRTVEAQLAAGCAVLKEFEKDVCANEALAEAWELSCWLFSQVLGPTHAADLATVIKTVDGWIAEAGSAGLLAELAEAQGKGKGGSKGFKGVQAPALWAALNFAHGDRVRGGMVALVSAVKGALPKRHKQPTPSSARGGGGGGGEKPGPQERGATPPSGSRVAMDVAGMDTQVDSVRNALKQVFDAISLLVKPAKRAPNAQEAACDGVLSALKEVRQHELGFFWDNAYAGSRLDALARDPLVGKITTKLSGLLATRAVDAEPRSGEARRRLTFFMNSLFMDMPKAPAVPDMHSFSVLTPFYSEDVIYTKADLEQQNSDGVTVLLYLQTLYKDDWKHFLERLGLVDVSLIWSPKYLMETRLWASLRAQTLSRTVFGMMQYEAALRLLAQLERVEHEELEEVLRLKFNYVVAAQVYGKMKLSQDGKAKDIEWLLHKYPNLRVAFIDEKIVNRQGGAHFYSCLIKASPDEPSGGVQTVYRVKLPGNPVIGEGKPENQNHAVIFSRGEYMQAIDMNQEGYLEEALKHRNLLEEFKFRDKQLPMTILGFREHIFTGGVSSVANYMALQEASFVTTGQRVLNRPLCVRLHYGHPDLFDKLFFAQNGGISKASKGINLSEDVFAGYNTWVRGGAVGFKEYCQVGKGRDVGLQQIYKFEAKLAQGNAEQCLSRDVDRLANRLDFPKLLSFFFGGIGHYINSTLTVFAIITTTYFITFMALFGFEKVGDREVVVLGNLQILLAGMGVVQTLPLLATLVLERGVTGALRELGGVFGSGGPFYFIFHIQTRAYYFFQTLIAGGAQYRATGRGFVTRHATFDENWRFFATSHMYLGIEILAAITVFSQYTGTKQFWGHSWSLTLAAMSFVWTPYWFNPLAFNWGAVAADYDKWLLWIRSEGGSATHSWPSWWREEKSYMASLRLAEKTTVVFRALLYLVLAVGVTGPDNLTPPRLVRFAKVLVLLGGMLVALVFMGRGSFASPGTRATMRLLKYPLAVGLAVSALSLVLKDKSMIHMCAGLYYTLAAVYTVGVVCGFPAVAQLLRAHDLICGHLMFLPLFALAALQLPDKIQTWLLYQNALSEGVLIDTILKTARKAQQKEEETTLKTNPVGAPTAEPAKPDPASPGGRVPSEVSSLEMQELRRMVMQQQQTIERLSTKISTGRSPDRPPAFENPTGPVDGQTDPEAPGAGPANGGQAPTMVFRGAGPIG